MIISDNFLVPYAGYLLVIAIITNAEGRAIYSSNNLGQMIVVISNQVYAISSNLTAQLVGTIATFVGDVYIDENNAGQIAICDRTNIYLYSYGASPGFTTVAGLGFIPGYISFQNGRFIAASLDTNQWRLSALNNGNSWPADANHVGLLQTKPDNVVAAQRFPGRGNLLFVFGSTVTEIWQDIGSNLFPYQRMSSVNIDYGCLNPATIAYNENMIAWLAANEKSGPFIAFSTGGDINKISTDGIDFKFTQLKNPSNAYGFLFRQDGHLIYQITFPDDNLTYIYDFNTKAFFTLCDENFNSHIAKRIAFYNDQYYFVSLIDGNVYAMSTSYTTYNLSEIPRIRVCKNLRMPDASRFAINNLTFTLETGTTPDIFLDDDLLTEDGQILMTEDGQDLIVGSEIIIYVDSPLMDELGNDLLAEDGEMIFATTPQDTPVPIAQTVELRVSKNGGESFGTAWRKDLPPLGRFRNRLIYWNLGTANDFVPQFRFIGMGRFVATDGLMSIYQ
jgi:hypothetical protein